MQPTFITVLCLVCLGLTRKTQSFVITPPPVECPNYLCKDKENGNYEYSFFGVVNPHYILQCSNGVASCQTCWPGNLFFRPDCNQCLFNYDDQCTATTSKTPQPTTATTTTKLSTKTTAQPQTTRLSIQCPQNECTKRGLHFSGNIADQSNHRQYIACWDGKTVGCVRCPANLVFDEIMNACVYPVAPDNNNGGLNVYL
eukprot:TCONS_00024631-protein